jgi:hypothetical protein
MARKRIQETADILQDAIRRLAPSRRDVDTEGLRRYRLCCINCNKSS